MLELISYKAGPNDLNLEIGNVNYHGIYLAS